MRTQEELRLQDKSDAPISRWRKWGTYLSERAWGTVREDYSPDGDAWNYLTHDAARSKAFRWGEDGIGGWCDLYQTVAFSVALWNGKDPILKERLFGLNPFEGNHGEDVKELYFYLDATPTHSYAKYLYKYPQASFPYEQLIEENRRRGTSDREYELVDTGVFNDGKYFDVVIEYAKEDEEECCVRIEIFNRASEIAEIHLIPQLWFRNRWSWIPELDGIPQIQEGPRSEDFISVFVDPKKERSPERLPFQYHLDPFYLYCDSGAHLLFTNNESNDERLYGSPNRTPYVKDAFHRYIVNKENCLNPNQEGSKVGFHFDALPIPAHGSKVIRLRLSSKLLDSPVGKSIDATVALRKKEADEFYESVHPAGITEEEKIIQRQALAGMLWSKQFYLYDVKKWFKGDNPLSPPPLSRYHIRNDHWSHLSSLQVISMPDKWEYPWFASWDLAFQTIALSLVDMELAKEQLLLLLTHFFQHPNGQIPAYEWEFSDLNPPVQAWALWRLYQSEMKKTGQGDRKFLEEGFLKLSNNFSCWVNTVDREGNNFFEGGFLGLDNISVIDRSKPLPGGGTIEQSDGTGWMAFFSLMMMRVALELAKEESIYEAMATIFMEHFFYIAGAMQQTSEFSLGRTINLWDEEDKFFYDVIAYPDGRRERLKVRSFVGIIPLYSVDFFDEDELKQFPRFYNNFQLFIKYHPKITENYLTQLLVNGKKRYLLMLMKTDQLQALLSRLWQTEEFSSPYGLRSLSKVHEKQPLIFDGSCVGYEPGESLEKIKGGNSNWRGPIWFPTNFLVIEALRKLSQALGDDFKINSPREDPINLTTMADQLSTHLINLFKKDPEGRRPIHGGIPFFQNDPHWSDLVLFYEHYHGDNGRGLGASHQTGWSGVVANLIDELKSSSL